MKRSTQVVQSSTALGSTTWTKVQNFLDTANRGFERVFFVLLQHETYPWCCALATFKFNLVEIYLIRRLFCFWAVMLGSRRGLGEKPTTNGFRAGLLWSAVERNRGSLESAKVGFTGIPGPIAVIGPFRLHLPHADARPSDGCVRLRCQCSSTMLHFMFGGMMAARAQTGNQPRTRKTEVSRTIGAQLVPERKLR